MMKNRLGFTMLELLVVIAVIGILSAIAMPNLVGWRQNRNFNTSVQRTISVMHSAKMHAVKENVPTVVRFNVDDNHFRAFVDHSSPFNNLWDPETDRLIDFYNMPHGIRITNASFAGGASWIRFNGRGMPNGLGGSVQLSSDRGLINAVVVNLTGRIRLTSGDTESE
ncbi:MAG: GspH/FimT family pseudopilin [Desulfobacterales bacterium]